MTSTLPLAALPASRALPAVFPAPLSPLCPIWCASDHSNPLMEGCHSSRTAKLVPPAGIELDRGSDELLGAELFYADESSNADEPFVRLVLTHAGMDDAVMSAEQADAYIARLEAFAATLRMLRAQMGGR